MRPSHSRSKPNKKMSSGVLNRDQPLQEKLIPVSRHQDRDTLQFREGAEYESIVFRQRFDAALQLAREADKQSKETALNMLFQLCMSYRSLPEDHKITGNLIENVVKNYLGLKNIIGGQSESNRQNDLEFIRYFTTCFEGLYKKTIKGDSISKQSLSLFFLIQANEEYHCKLYRQALRSCQKSIDYCRGTKSQIDIHLMKVEFLKSNIFGLLKDDVKELESIKECLKNINSLSGNISDMQTKQYILNLKKIITEKKQMLIQKQGKNENGVDPLRRPPSLNKFRTRSISLKKSESQKDMVLQKPIQKTFRGATPDRLQPQREPLRIDSLHITKSAHHSKHASVQFQPQKEYFTMNISKPQKKTQLKKRALKIEPSNPQSIKQQISEMAVDEIQNQAPPVFRFEDLMVARPKPKKQDKQEENSNMGDDFDEFDEEPQVLVIQKKKSDEGNSSRIQPVTHYIRRSISNERCSMLQNGFQEIVWQCIQQEEENILKGYLKSVFPQEPEDIRVSQMDSLDFDHSKQTSLKIREKESLIESEGNQNNFQPTRTTDKKLHYTKIRQSLLSLNPGILDQEREIFSYSNRDFDIDDSVGLCTTFGYLSKFTLKLKILGYSKDTNKEEQRMVLIEFQCMLNDDQYVQVELKYNLGSIYESDIYVILYELNRNILPQIKDIPEQIAHRLFTLVVNQIIAIKKINGNVLVSKVNQTIKRNPLVEKYKKDMMTRLINYELNNYTSDFLKKQAVRTEGKQKKGREVRISTNFNKESKVDFAEEESQGSDTFSNYLPNLAKKFTQDVRDDSSSVSSLRRMKTDRMFKNTLFSYKSTMKSIDLGEFNLYVKDDDIKSLNLAIMPSDFHQKISRYFQEGKDGKEPIPFQQFYYCMKFVLIKPQNKTEDAFLNCFFDSMEVECLHFLQNKQRVSIKMTCYKSKEIFRNDHEIFYKFDVEYITEKIKSVKFIATSKDLRLIYKKASKSNKRLQSDINLRSSKRFLKQKAFADEDSDFVQLKRQSMLALLKQLSAFFMVKKTYIYSVVGFQNKNSYFNYINKFRLEGKTTQGKNFMINHLKHIHIFFQKSIKIECENFKWFSVLTVRQILGSWEFSIIFYVPKLQKTFTAALTKNVLSYLDEEALRRIFTSLPKDRMEMERELFTVPDDIPGKMRQREAWNGFSQLFQFQNRFMDDRSQILLKIGRYCAFLKDTSFSEYFQIDKKIYSIEMSLNRRGSPLSTEIQDRNKFKNLKLVKRKSSSTKEILINKKDYCQQSILRLNRRKLLKTFQKELQDKDTQNKTFGRNDGYDQFNEIYESDISKYVLYITLNQILEIDADQKIQPPKVKKITFFFYLSDLCSLIKKCKEELRTLGLNSRIQFNQEVFSFALLLRTMTVIKYRIIKQLKSSSQTSQIFIEQLFDGSRTLQNQKKFKNRLSECFMASNWNYYSLNAFKRHSSLERNVFVVHKNVMNLKKGELVNFMFNQNQNTLTIFLINSSSLENKHKTMKVSQMRFPWVSFLKSQDLVTVNRRIFAYYQNILLLE